MTSDASEQHGTLAGLSYNAPVTIREQTGPDQWGPECKFNNYLLKLANGSDPKVTLEVAQEASRLYGANKKRVVITVAKGKGIAIRPA